MGLYRVVRRTGRLKKSNRLPPGTIPSKSSENASGATGREFESLRAHQFNPFCIIRSPHSAPGDLILHCTYAMRTMLVRCTNNEEGSPEWQHRHPELTASLCARLKSESRSSNERRMREGRISLNSSCRAHKRRRRWCWQTKTAS